MSLTASQLQVILTQAAVESGGKFTPFNPVYYAGVNAGSVNAWLTVPGNAGKSLLEHFVQVGSVQGFRTSPEFDPQFYFNQWPDLRAAGLDGTELLAHYTLYGIAEGRAAVDQMLTFDGARYLAQYPDVAAYVNANLDDFLGSASNGAGAHYVKFGAREGREAFSVSGQPIDLVGLTKNPAFAPITFVDGVLNLDTNGGDTTLTKAATAADGSTTAGVLRLSGDTVVRIDLTNSQRVITGIDLNGKNAIESNGIENNVAGAGILTAKSFTIVDAYARNPLNQLDSTNNYLGNIYFDGTGYAGDGVKTNGNIFLGGLGNDTAFGGIGNDFLAGGGSPALGQVGQAQNGDNLNGVRNSDFFFGELSALSPTDGNNSFFDGGSTADNTVAAGFPTPGTINDKGGLGTQDNDTLLLEVSDDNEPITVNLTETTNGVTTRSGAGFTIQDMESVNASGNLYGFLNNVNTVVGARSYDGYGDGFKAGTENYGRGSTGQLIVNGSNANNLVIGGFDNDQIFGGTGDDLLMGGDLQFLVANQNNKNLVDSKGGLDLTANSVGVVFDGRDILSGQNDNDQIAFEADGGTISGDADTGKTSGAAGAVDDRPYTGPRFASQGDGLFLTNFSTGRVAGATLAGEATAQGDALAKMTTDSTVRIDLGTGNAFKGYGGAATGSQDTTNYATGVTRTTVGTMESVNATGLGAIDYKAAGSNSPELKFHNQQNYFGLNANVDLRGTGADNALLANTGSDTVEGRGGDDVMSGGLGKDMFVEQFGDGVDWIARPVDANGDNIWDTTGGLVVTGGLAWGQDFRAPAAPTAGTTTLLVNFGATVLDGVSTFVATFQVVIDTVQFGQTIPASTLAAAKNTTEVATIVNAAYHAQDSNVTVVATSLTTIEVRVVDATPGAPLPVVSTTPAEGFFVAGQAPGAGNTFSASGAILTADGSNLEDDRGIIKSYDDRSINLGMDQTKVQVSQAADMVANFAATGSQLVQGQASRLYINDVHEGDTVAVTINGTVYGYTVKAGENADNAATGLTAVITNFLDINAASGTVNAVADLGSFGDDNGVNRAGVLITQAVVLNSQTFMALTAAVTRTDGAPPFGTVATHNQSNTELQILGFDGRNGALTAVDGTPVVLFQGRNGGTTTMSLLATAKDAGQTVTGTSANQSKLALGNWVNGDDLLYGGKGNDKMIGATGDDRFIMTAGTDTVFGDNEDGTGRFDLQADGTTKQIYQDVLQAEEGTFGTGTKFAVTLDAAVAGKGVMQALDSTGAVLATTNFSGIELVRALENNRTSSLDLKALSDETCKAIGDNSLPQEGLYVLLTKAPATFTLIDKNGDGDTLDAGETTTVTAVLGTENLTTGNSPDFVTLDQTQASANNVLDLGAQQDNIVLATLRESADVVTYDHKDVNNDGVVNAADVTARPTLTVAVLGASSSTVAMTAGALGAKVVTDTLKNVEIVDVTDAATSGRFNDVVDLSALAGGTVNYGAAEAVGKSAGGGNPVTTVAQLDANTLDSGGVALTGNTLGTELITITGVTAAGVVIQPSVAITTLERVTGSAGNDRVIVADTMPIVAAGAFAAADGPRTTKFDYTPATGAVGSPPAARADQGLFQWNLGAGTNDMVDYKQETTSVVVSVDTTAADNELIWVDARIDSATGVERYFGGNNGNANWIDLGAATVATTIQFSKEAKSNVPPNEFADPAGNDGTTVDGLTRTAEVRNTADSTPYASFVDRTGAGTVTTASFWLNVFGSKNAETVLFTDNETALAHNLQLRGGANKVDYSALTGTINAAIGKTDTGLASLLQKSIVNGDAIDVTRASDPATNNLTIVASTRAGDQLDVTAFLNGAVVIANPGVPTTSQVDPLFHVVNLATGVVTESVFGQYTPVGAPAGTAQARSFLTFFSGFENASNALDADVVHMLGDNGRNALTGGNADDLIYGARGTAGDGTVVLAAGNRGDTLTGNPGADLFLYKGEAESPGGLVSTGQQSAAIFTNDTNVTNSIDTIPAADFVTGTDKFAFVINDTYDAVRVTGAIPANLAGVLNSFVPMPAPVFVAGDTVVNIPKDVTAAPAGQVDNYDINNIGSTAVRADLIMRVNATSGSDVIDASAGLAVTALNAASADGLRVDLVYTAANQSQAGGFDQVIHFTTGGDKIDLSFLQLPRYESSLAGNGVNFDTNGNQIVDALEGNAIRALGAAPIIAVNASAANLFIDGAVYKPIATQTLADGNGDPSTTVFIDRDGNGNYDPNLDMAVVLIGVAAPVTGDFIFTQYGGGWGG